MLGQPALGRVEQRVPFMHAPMGPGAHFQARQAPPQPRKVFAAQLNLDFLDPGRLHNRRVVYLAVLVSGISWRMSDVFVFLLDSLRLGLAG